MGVFLSICTQGSMPYVYFAARPLPAFQGQSLPRVGRGAAQRNAEPLVLYQALYGAHGLWVRRLPCSQNKLRAMASPARAFAMRGPLHRRRPRLADALAHSLSLHDRPILFSI